MSTTRHIPTSFDRPVHIRLAPGTPVVGEVSTFQYAFAGQTLITDRPLSRLAPFFESQGRRDARAGDRATGPSGAVAAAVFQGSALIDDQPREIECRQRCSGYEVHVHGAGWFGIAADGSSIDLLARDLAGDLAGVEAALVGPALSLALALRGVFLLDAACIGIGDEAVALVGASHIDKAGLARAVVDRREPACRVLGGGALPVVGPGRVVPTGQGPRAEPMPLRSIYLLELLRPGEGPWDPLLARPSTPDSTLTLMHHTRDSYLFAPDLLERHLNFCVELARTVPVRRISFYEHARPLPIVAGLVEADLGQPTAAPLAWRPDVQRQRRSDVRVAALGPYRRPATGVVGSSS